MEAEQLIASSSNDSTRDKRIQNINEYWEISNGRDSLYAYVVQTDPFTVQYFERTNIGDGYRLNDAKFEVFIEDFVKKNDYFKIS